MYTFEARHKNIPQSAANSCLLS